MGVPMKKTYIPKRWEFHEKFVLPGLEVSGQQKIFHKDESFGTKIALPVMSASLHPFSVDVFEVEKFRPGLEVSMQKINIS